VAYIIAEVMFRGIFLRGFFTKLWEGVQNETKTD
jgi:hypothetical protein